MVNLNLGKRVADAKNLWFRSVMNDTNDALVKGKLKELDVKDIDGLKIVVGRAEIGLQKFFGKNYLPVIMGHTRVAELVMMSAHWKDHTGRYITMAMARHEAWIVNAKKLAKLLIRLCVRCRYIRKMLEGQKMAVLPGMLAGSLPSLCSYWCGSLRTIYSKIDDQQKSHNKSPGCYSSLSQYQGHFHAASTRVFY